MRTVFAVALTALTLASAADAKLEISLHLSKNQPKVNERVRAVVRSEERMGGDCTMRLIAVAPGANVSLAIEAFVAGGVSIQGPTGYRFRRIRPTPRLGFEASAKRIDPKTWCATIRFPRAGGWSCRTSALRATCNPGPPRVRYWFANALALPLTLSSP